MGRKPDIAPQGHIKLVELPRWLRDEEGTTVTYHQCYTAAVNGLIPVSRSASGSRWLVNEHDIPTIALTLTENTHGEEAAVKVQDKRKRKGTPARRRHRPRG